MFRDRSPLIPERNQNVANAQRECQKQLPRKANGNWRTFYESCAAEDKEFLTFDSRAVEMPVLA
jgi:hypothetical protein